MSNTTTPASSINLTKGERVDLTKTNPGLAVAAIGLGWDTNEGNGPKYDLDAFAFALTGGKMKLPDSTSILFFNSPRNADGKLSIMNSALIHSGDNLTGAGSGDDETLLLNFSKLPADTDEIIIGVNIYEGAARRQNFGMVNNAFIRVYDADTKAEILKFDLTEDYSAFTGMVMGKLYKKDGEWKFQAIGEGKNGSIIDITNPYMPA
jgi:tellurium resistance protein TerD